jgi:hypothetical protein
MEMARLELYHGQFNLDKRDNLSEIPAGKAVFGIFAIVDENPVNCRYVAVAHNLREAVRELYETPPGEGMKNFMQGAWIPMLVYNLDVAAEDVLLEREKEEWIKRYNPKIDVEGEYPGYYE